MRLILNQNDGAEIASRVRSLSVSSTPRWGGMDVASMLQQYTCQAKQE